MARVIITLRIMPEAPDTALQDIEKIAESMIEAFGGNVGKKEIEEVAYGLKALKLYFVMDEAKGSTEVLENEISAVEGVASVEVIDVRRAVG